MKIISRLSFAFIITLFAHGELIHAQLTDTTWQGAGGGNWSVAGNWTGGIPNASSARAVLNNLSSGASPVVLNSTYTIGGLDIASGFTLKRSDTDANLRAIAISAATAANSFFRNAGTISSSGASNILRLSINPGAGTIVNSGIMEATAGSELHVQSTSNATLTLNNAGGTLRTVGSGILSLAATTSGVVALTGGNLQNAAGTINQAKSSTFTDVTITNGGTYNVDMGITAPGNPYGMILNGTTSFTNSGSLNLIRTIDATVSHGQALNFNINSAGASVTNSGSMVFRTVGNGTAGNGGNAGLSFTVSSALHNTGTITLDSQSSANQTRLLVGASQTATFTGTGSLVMQVGAGGSASMVLITGGTDSTLVNSTGHTIKGAGSLGNNGLLNLTNQGTIEADDATQALTIDLRTAGTFANSGTLRAKAAGGLVVVDGAFSNSGTLRVDAGSTFAVQGGTLTSSGTLLINGDFTSTPTVNVTGGKIQGTGTLTGEVNVSNAIQIAPQTLSGDSLTVDGNLTLTASGSLRTISMSYDQSSSTLNVTGNLAVGSNNAFEFTFQPGSGYLANTIYTLINVGGTNTANLSLFNLSAASLSAGYVLDSSFGSNAGWNLNGSDIEVRFSAIPEPGTSALVGVFIIGVYLRRRTRKTFGPAKG